MTKEQCLSLIERLAGGDVGEFLTINATRIGNILEKMKGKGKDTRNLGAMEYDILDLVQYWQPCGFSKSLFEILEESEWEKEKCPDGYDSEDSPCYELHKRTIKSPTLELFTFIGTLFPSKE